MPTSKKPANQMSASKNPIRQLCASTSGTSALEFAMLYGLLLAMVMIVAHIALLYNANLTVADAADAALEELTSNSGTPESARSVARYISHDAPLYDFELEFGEIEPEGNSQANGPRQVFVRATAKSPELILGLPVEVSHTAAGAPEQFVTEQSRTPSR